MPFMFLSLKHLAEDVVEVKSWLEVGEKEPHIYFINENITDVKGRIKMSL